MANATERNLANPFLLLPSLVRDEVYSYLLPSRSVIWLGRNASDPRSRVDTPPASFRVMEFYNAFWRRRQLEYQALAHWYPGQTGVPMGSKALPQTEGYIYGKNGVAVRDILTLRLVCRQVSEEAIAILFRRVTLWWTLWDAEMEFIEALVGLEDHLTESEGTTVDQILLPLPERYRRQGVSQEQWASFVRGKQRDGLLRWVARFRNVNLVIQDSSILKGFHLTQTMLRLSRPTFFRTPALHFVVCGFRINFNQARNAWEVLLKNGRNTAEDVLDARWTGAEGGTGQNCLSISNISETGDREFWSCTSPNHWLGSHEFCNVPFRVDAMFHDTNLDMQGKLLFYTPAQPTPNE